MPSAHLRPAEPERDFGQLASWFALLEDDALSEQGLKEYYAKRRAFITQKVAEDEQGELLGFYWMYHDETELCRIDLFVEPHQRGQGVGRQLYEDLERAARDLHAKTLQASVAESDADSQAFAERCGFRERWHFIPMRLDLETFDARPYDAIIAKLEGAGFRFTSMEKLGNTEEAQRRLYVLNDTTDLDVPGRNDEHNWKSFEDFQERVCRADWYRPAGQILAIDTSTGDWAAMSAISRFSNHAYNLHTGVDRRYRGRKLAQAVKALALRYARDVLQVRMVHTDHNTMNAPMIAIDRKFGYFALPGTFVMRKLL